MQPPQRFPPSDRHNTQAKRPLPAQWRRSPNPTALRSPLVPRAASARPLIRPSPMLPRGAFRDTPKPVASGTAQGLASHPLCPGFHPLPDLSSQRSLAQKKASTPDAPSVRSTNTRRGNATFAKSGGYCVNRMSALQPNRNGTLSPSMIWNAHNMLRCSRRLAPWEFSRN